jgi:Fe-S-cluster containining protein
MLSESYGVPEEMSLPTTPYQNAMKGTDQDHPRCIAFVGQVGKASSCSIYENRPGCCRLFKASFENGERSLECEKCRIGKSLPPLTASDWTDLQLE